MSVEPGWDRLLTAARRSWERTGGRIESRITLRDPDDVERRAVIALTGRHRPPGVARVSVTLAELDGGLRRTTGESLPEVLSRIGPPLRDRPAEKAAEQRERTVALAALHSGVHGAEQWFVAWREALLADGTLTRLVRRGEVRLAALAVAVLDRLPADGVPLPVLAEAVTGDTKALAGGTLAQLVLRALAMRAGAEVPSGAEARRALWDTAGVVVDDLASQVLVLNLPAAGDGLGSWLTDAAARAIPMRVTLHQLTAMPITVRADRVYVCENPAVLRAASRIGPGCAPLICTEGLPSTACWRLLEQLDGAAVRWRSDFDWVGLRITGAAVRRVGAVPWRMAAGDYVTALERGDSEQLRGVPAESPWDDGLAVALASTGRAVMEERLVPDLLDDLGKAR